MTSIEQARTTRIVTQANLPHPDPHAGPPLPGPSRAEPDPSPPALDPEVSFRFPAPDDPAPGAARMLAIALYSAALGLCGVAVGLWAVMAVFSGAPGWYLPVLALLTMLSVAPVVAAFLAIHQRTLPWILLLAAAPPMAGNVLVALSY